MQYVLNFGFFFLGNSKRYINHIWRLNWNKNICIDNLKYRIHSNCSTCPNRSTPPTFNYSAKIIIPIEKNRCHWWNFKAFFHLHLLWNLEYSQLRRTFLVTDSSVGVLARSLPIGKEEKNQVGQCRPFCALWQSRTMAFGLHAHLRSDWRQQISFLPITWCLGGLRPRSGWVGLLVMQR